MIMDALSRPLPKRGIPDGHHLVLQAEGKRPLGIQPEQQTNVLTNVLAALAADSAWSTRRIGHNVANADHCALETILLGV